MLKHFGPFRYFAWSIHQGLWGCIMGSVYIIVTYLFLVGLVELITERFLYLSPIIFRLWKSKLSEIFTWGHLGGKAWQERLQVLQEEGGDLEAEPRSFPSWDGCHIHVNPLGIGWPKVCCLHLGVVVFWKTSAHDRKAMRSQALSSGRYDQL